MEFPNIHGFPKTKGAYIVGGSVRDLLLNREPTDYDIAVLENPEKFAQQLANHTGGRIVKIGKPGLEVLRVTAGAKTIDVTGICGESIETDLSQRDFTINAMGYELGSGTFIDCLGGLDDLENRCIRMVSGNIFLKDPIRLLRAFRIAAHLDFDIEPDTLRAIQKNAAGIRKSAGERIRHEFLRLLQSQNAFAHLSGMKETGLLFAIIPELERLRGCTQNIHHAHDVLEHTSRAIDHLEHMLHGPRDTVPGTFEHIRKYAKDRRTALLKWAMMLHDIGKPAVRTRDDKGQIHFYGHARKSAEIASDIARRLRFSNQDRADVDLLIRQHMQPFFLFRAGRNSRLTSRSRVRFFLKCGEHTPGVLINAIADMRGKLLKPENLHAPFIRFATTLMENYFSDFRTEKSHPPLISGYDLIETLGLSPSPMFKKILRSVEEARLAKLIFDKSEALQYIKDTLTLPSAGCGASKRHSSKHVIR